MKFSEGLSARAGEMRFFCSRLQVSLGKFQISGCKKKAIHVANRDRQRSQQENNKQPCAKVGVRLYTLDRLGSHKETCLLHRAVSSSLMDLLLRKVVRVLRVLGKAKLCQISISSQDIPFCSRQSQPTKLRTPVPAPTSTGWRGLSSRLQSKACMTP